jgi:hypothetical protein
MVPQVVLGPVGPGLRGNRDVDEEGDVGSAAALEFDERLVAVVDGSVAGFGVIEVFRCGKVSEGLIETDADRNANLLLAASRHTARTNRCERVVRDPYGPVALRSSISMRGFRGNALLIRGINECSAIP